MPSSPGLCGAEKWHFEAMQPVGLEEKKLHEGLTECSRALTYPDIYQYMSNKTKYKSDLNLT